MCLKLTVSLLLLHSLSFALPVSKPMEYYLITPSELQLLKSNLMTLEKITSSSAILLNNQSELIEKTKIDSQNLEKLQQEKIVLKNENEVLTKEKEVLSQEREKLQTELNQLSIQQEEQIQTSQQIIKKQELQINQSEQSLEKLKKEIQYGYQRLENEKYIWTVSGVAITSLVFIIYNYFTKK